MVRLRRDRWYTADGQKRSRSRVKQQGLGGRRLISLCFLLGLVVLLMQRSADPKYISNAFRALGVPLEDSSPVTGRVTGVSATSTSGPNTHTLTPKHSQQSFGQRCFLRLWYRPGPLLRALAYLLLPLSALFREPLILGGLPRALSSAQ